MPSEKEMLKQKTPTYLFGQNTNNEQTTQYSILRYSRVFCALEELERKTQKCFNLAK